MSAEEMGVASLLIDVTLRGPFLTERPAHKTPVMSVVELVVLRASCSCAQLLLSVGCVVSWSWTQVNLKFKSVVLSNHSLSSDLDLPFYQF